MRKPVPKEEWKRAFADAAAEEAGDLEGATAMYRSLAVRGDANRQHSLAYHLDAVIVPRRPVEAVYWYKRAISGGLAVSAWNMAMRYRLSGSRRWYVHWLKVAARLGDDDASTALEALPELGDYWWKLENVCDPPTAERGFKGNVLSLKERTEGV